MACDNGKKLKQALERLKRALGHEVTKEEFIKEVNNGK